MNAVAPADTRLNETTLVRPLPASHAPRAFSERIVIATVPRWDSAAGRCLAVFDHNPGRSFTPTDIAAHMGFDLEVVRVSLLQLRNRGLILCRRMTNPAGGQKLAVYTVAPDLRCLLKPGARLP